MVFAIIYVNILPKHMSYYLLEAVVLPFSFVNVPYHMYVESSTVLVKTQEQVERFFNELPSSYRGVLFKTVLNQ